MEFVSWGYYSQYMKKSDWIIIPIGEIKVMFQTTNQLRLSFLQMAAILHATGPDLSFTTQQNQSVSQSNVPGAQIFLNIVLEGIFQKIQHSERPLGALKKPRMSLHLYTYHNLIPYTLW